MNKPCRASGLNIGQLCYHTLGVFSAGSTQSEFVTALMAMISTTQRFLAEPDFYAMKIVIINPPDENLVSEFQDESGRGFLEASDFGKFPPLGPLYVLTNAQYRCPQHEYYFLDCVSEDISHSALAHRLRKIGPDVVGFTSFTISLLDVIKAAETARAIAPDAHLCLGGHHPTAFPLEAAMLPQFDSIIIGEGEHAFAALIECLDAQKSFTDIPGVYTASTIRNFFDPNYEDVRFRNYLNVPPGYIEDIDAIPPPDRKYISHVNYNSILGVTAKLTTVLTSRGCPYKCTFCDVPYKKYRPRNIELVMDEIEACLDMGYEEFHFYDDLFNITPQRVAEFCAALKRRNLNIIWDFRGRVNSVTYESLQDAKSIGLRMISFGVETGSDEGLSVLQKGCTVKQIEQVFRWCRQLGIKTVADYMIGLPHEKSVADIRKSIDFLICLDPDYAQIGIMNLYPHTQIYKEAVARGLAEPGRWQKWALNPKPGFYVDHWTEFVSDQELVRLHRESYRRFYFRVPYIMRSVYSLRSFHELKSKTVGAAKLLLRR